MTDRKLTKAHTNKSSIIELVAKYLPQDKQQELIRGFDKEFLELLEYNWLLYSRPNQIPPLDEDWWTCWLILAGRGFGKTRAGAECVREVVEGGAKKIALIGESPSAVRDVMIRGESGLMGVFPEGKKPNYLPSKRRVEFYNGAEAIIFSSHKPNALRGGQFEFCWMDELASFRYLEDTFDMLMMGLRLGRNPRAIITTTPRPLELIKELIEDKNTYVTRGSSWDNASNLPPVFYDKIISKYEGTRLGRQELYAEILSDTPGALWSRDLLEEQRLKYNQAPKLEDLKRIVIGVDPAVSSNKNSDSTGITVCGVDKLNRGYVIEDLTPTNKVTPDKWAKIVVNAYHEYKADLVVGETNQGGDLVEQVVRTIDENINFKQVRATRGKFTRAEPVSALYEQGKVYHLGCFAKLEDELCNWVQGDSDSPDRLDSLVWALTELMLRNNRGLSSKATPIGLYKRSRFN